MNWRPIETAPKDNTDLLLGFSNGDDVTVGSFCREAWMDQHGWGLEPTHWMPLPEQPKGD